MAVSGGADSMALLSMCLEEGRDIACAHVNYHHRPQAEEEEAYIRSFCSEHGIVCHVDREPFVWEGNFEAAAREKRYAFFARLVKEYGYSGVLTGHQKDDLIETFLMQEEKGLVPDWYGLKEERMIHGVMVCRPLLGYTKQELEDYCRTRGIRTFYDETNGDPGLTRNRIRMETVEGMSPFEKDMVLREIRQKNAVLQERRCRVKAGIREGKVSLAEYRKWKEEDRLTLLYEMLSGTVNYSRKGLLEIDRILCKKADFRIPAGSRELVQKDGRFFLAEPAEPYVFTVETPEQLAALSSPYFRIETGVPGVHAVTVTEADFPLTIRSVQSGDKIRMRFGTKPVHRFFIDRHIPLFERTSWPVVTNAENTVILVPGLGCDCGHYSKSPTFSVIQLSSYE